MDSPATLEKPQRWDSSFDPEQTPANVVRLLATAPFSGMDTARFPKRTPLAGILQHDTRIRRFRNGEIIVREGDYGTSAFLILAGAARVVLRPSLPAAVLGRRTTRRKGFAEIISQLWSIRGIPKSANAPSWNRTAA